MTEQSNLEADRGAFCIWYRTRLSSENTFIKPAYFRCYRLPVAAGLENDEIFAKVIDKNRLLDTS